MKINCTCPLFFNLSNKLLEYLELCTRLCILNNAALGSWGKSWLSYSVKYGELKSPFLSIKEKSSPKELGHKVVGMDRLSTRRCNG